ncbi:hypothetical protein J5N97_023824 [Dioscorea zingiberensis]|uniref:Uncharacterized protein n=1 Tax=Dioscorea zingiberensis TaxID=325984 RepID=A0A9D5C5G7_9LILI|nr:hypothetical protein J5N97_023824 [Dioscorea zingiberensis]
MNPKKLLKMAKKWQKVAAAQGRRSSRNSDDFGVSNIANKGHFFVYTREGKRFMVPLGYLESTVFQEILKISEEEFGLPSHGPITLPFDAVFMEYVVSCLGRRLSEDAEREMFNSILVNYRSNCTLIPDQQHMLQPLVCSF